MRNVHVTPSENQNTAERGLPTSGVMLRTLARYKKPLGKMHSFILGRLYARAPDLAFFLFLGL
jgi:hypothetical protein